LYDEFEEHGINGCVQNKTLLKYAKNHGNWFRHFEDISRICEPSNVLAYFFWLTLHIASLCNSSVFIEVEVGHLYNLRS